jgi:hypothetical protein
MRNAAAAQAQWSRGSCCHSLLGVRRWRRAAARRCATRYGPARRPRRGLAPRPPPPPRPQARRPRQRWAPAPPGPRPGSGATPAACSGCYTQGPVAPPPAWLGTAADGGRVGRGGRGVQQRGGRPAVKTARLGAVARALGARPPPNGLLARRPARGWPGHGRERRGVAPLNSHAAATIAVRVRRARARARGRLHPPRRPRRAPIGIRRACGFTPGLYARAPPVKNGHTVPSPRTPRRARSARPPGHGVAFKRSPGPGAGADCLRRRGRPRRQRGSGRARRRRRRGRAPAAPALPHRRGPSACGRRGAPGRLLRARRGRGTGIRGEGGRDQSGGAALHAPAPPDRPPRARAPPADGRRAALWRGERAGARLCAGGTPARRRGRGRGRSSGRPRRATRAAAGGGRAAGRHVQQRRRWRRPRRAPGAPGRARCPHRARRGAQG